MKNNIYEQLIKYLNKTKKYQEVPVCAFIVKNNKIIAKATNSRIKTNKIIGHAEINCILKANKKLKSFFLYDCDLYVTLEPCEMCKNVINASRINNVYYLLEKEKYKKEYSKTRYNKVTNEYELKYKKIINNFFNKKRK